MARAIYAFEGQQDGDLSFQEGEIITIIQKSDSQDDWWTGKIGNRQGVVSTMRLFTFIIVNDLF
jgi:hypothetical protein